MAKAKVEVNFGTVDGIADAQEVVYRGVASGEIDLATSARMLNAANGAFKTRFDTRLRLLGILNRRKNESDLVREYREKLEEQIASHLNLGVKALPES